MERERERGREVGSSEAGFEALGISSVWSMYTCVRYLPLGPKSYPESERPTSKDAASLVETPPIGSDDTSSYMWCTPPPPTETFASFVGHRLLGTGYLAALEKAQVPAWRDHSAASVFTAAVKLLLAALSSVRERGLWVSDAICTVAR